MSIPPNRLRFAQKTGSVKRSAIDAGTGRSGDGEQVISSILCTDKFPLDANSINRYRTQEGLNANAALWQVVLFKEYDVRKGDTFVLDGTSYPVHDVMKWKQGSPFTVLVLEDVAGAAEVSFVR